MHDGLWNWKFAKLSIAFISWAKICHVCYTSFLILEWKLSFTNWKRTPETENVKNWRILNFVWGLKCLWMSLFSYSILISYSISIQFYSILFYSILFYSILFYSILFYSILFYSILFYSILFYSILFYLSPHGINYNIYFFVLEKVYFKSYIDNCYTSIEHTRTFSHSSIAGFWITLYTFKEKTNKQTNKKTRKISHFRAILGHPKWSRIYQYWDVPGSKTLSILFELQMLKSPIFWIIKGWQLHAFSP